MRSNSITSSVTLKTVSPMVNTRSLLNSTNEDARERANHDKSPPLAQTVSGQYSLSNDQNIHHTGSAPLLSYKVQNLSTPSSQESSGIPVVFGKLSLSLLADAAVCVSENDEPSIVQKKECTDSDPNPNLCPVFAKSFKYQVQNLSTPSSQGSSGIPVAFGKLSLSLLADAAVCVSQHDEPSIVQKKERTDSDPNPNLCPVCAKSFKDQWGVNRHMIVHREAKDYVCELCEKGFKERSALIRHMKMHSTVKSYVCDICEEGFVRKCYLEEHKRRHMEDKPYSCDVCDARFTHRSNLSRHKNYFHVGPCYCTACGKECRTRSDLKRHVATHSGWKGYSCDTCGKVYIELCSFNTHKKRCKFKKIN